MIGLLLIIADVLVQKPHLSYRRCSIQFPVEEAFLVFLVSCSVLTVPGFQYHMLEHSVLMRTFLFTYNRKGGRVVLVGLLKVNWLCEINIDRCSTQGQ